MSVSRETRTITPGPSTPLQTPDVSVLSAGPVRVAEPVSPDTLTDLRLDHVLSSLSDAGKDSLMVELFTRPPGDADTVEYRQEVCSDLRDPAVRRAVATFRQGMGRIDERVRSAITSGPSEYHWQQRRRLAEAMADYTHLVQDLRARLDAVTLHSRGMSAVHAYLESYATSPEFEELIRSTGEVINALDRVRFRISMEMGLIVVTPAEQEGTYNEQMAALFERFQDDAVPRGEGGKQEKDPGITHVTAGIVAQAARMEPKPFTVLAEHCRQNANFRDETLVRFAQEAGFYLAYLGEIAPLEEAGLAFCRPGITVDGKRLEARDSFDLALALQVVAKGEDVVTNDAQLDGAERVLVVTGPNQGGKTTYARMIGQLHHLASIGLPVPGRDVELPLVDRVLTHFERVEGVGDPTGKLEEELVRMRRMLEIATPRSLVVLNEAFTSTSLQDARELGKRVLEKIIATDMLAVYVTFVDELSRLGPATVSLVSQTSHEDLNRRTFTVSRQHANGTARALALAARHGLTLPQLLERIPS
ncbi:MutS-related protein [Tessaracoccus antarcticus]|uniref:DNA mismatch repair protein MutS n=1 Tax=Tessaracoccus antarcticus TaxID=2479848 RepID=A0A3M0GSB0_9ACTN|nr:DNA mismatch repair protein MutS [Tessaracoccus antarcticus]RMB60196.1 DNA mismatch repair protein MutS [Tessaracoccus antarcticus]